MAYSVVLLACLVFCAGALAVERQVPTHLPELRATTALRIIDGDVVPSPNPYPWAVSLTFGCSDNPQAQFQCAGSLIQSNVVLTAAHCWDFDCEATPWGIATTGLDRTDPDEGLRVLGKVTHPGYNPNTLSDDIAFWVMDGEFQNVGTFASLPTGNIRESAKVTIAGWGLTENGRSSQVLLRAGVEVQPDATCGQLFPQTYREDTQLCAGTDGGGKDSCNGDSGGPLFTTGDGCAQLEGLTSYGSPDCGSLDGAVYTRIIAYVGWIEATMAEVGVERNSPGSCSTSNNSIGLIIGIVVGVILVVIIVIAIVVMRSRSKESPSKAGAGGYRPAVF